MRLPCILKDRFDWRKKCLSRFVLLAFVGTCIWLRLGSSQQQQLQQQETPCAESLPQPSVPNASYAERASEATQEAERGPSIEAIKLSISRYNRLQTVLNEDVFGPVKNDSVVIVVQVHTRLAYLKELILSLKEAKYISDSLLIFSHDFYDEAINELVQSVDFCKVLQIFYPFSIQTHPREFPGEDPLDCPRDMKKEEALVKNCRNSRYPDLYGHYREAAFTQTKHHWWWKANQIFNHIDVLRHHTGLVLFLEEDHYVAEDFLHVLQLMAATGRSACSKCNVISLGTYLKTYSYYGNVKKESRSTKQSVATWDYQLLPSLYQRSQRVEISPWVSSKHNMGMAFNKSIWAEIMNCSQYFCKFDDYNWDWSLQHVSQKCMVRKLHAMVVRGPRVFHIGECGVHHKKKNCESASVVSKLKKVLKNVQRLFFPSHLTLTYTINSKKAKLHKGNGGWGDLRDHQLCMGISAPPE